MTKNLKELLLSDYRNAVEAQVSDENEARLAREFNHMPMYFDFSLHLQLADVCWALGKWDEAKRWYRHNAQVLMERRNWRAKSGGPEAQTMGISDWEASTLIKAGRLQEGREYVRLAIEYWVNQPYSEIRLTQLGLHSAQVGLSDLATYALSIIDARQQLPEGAGQAAKNARKLLNYEPAQINMLLGQWDEFLKEISLMKEGRQLIENSSGLVFPEPLQNALIAAARGLEAIASLYAGEIEPKLGGSMATNAFEEAMSHFYKFSGQVDWDIYFMRLNTYLADNLATGKPTNPNPFVDE